MRDTDKQYLLYFQQKRYLPFSTQICITLLAAVAVAKVTRNITRSVLMWLLVRWR